MLHLVLALAIASPAPDPYQIYARARAYWEAQRYPQYLDYDTVVDARDAKRGERIERYASAYDAQSGRVWIDPVSDYEVAHPATGKGIAFGSPSHAPQPAPDQDFIGVPFLAPNYSFTIGRFIRSPAAQDLTPDETVAQVRDAFHDPNPRPAIAPTSTALSEITSVVAYRHDYRIDLAGEEEVDGSDVYHLTFAPIHIDGRYRLRDVWIEKGSYATVRARTALNFVDGPGTQIPWTIDFGAVAGARYITSERADGVYNYATRKYDSVSVRFENIRPRQAPLPFELAPPSGFLILTEPQS